MEIKAYGQTDDERIIAEMFKQEIINSIKREHGEIENSISANDILAQVQRELDR